MEKCAFDLNEQGCSALTKKECEGCRFYKTAEQVAEGRRKAKERLDSIPGGLYLYKKYHCGDGGLKNV